MNQWQTIYSTILLMMFVSIQGCATTNEKVLEVDPTNVMGMVDMRTEMTAVLEDLGYEWQPILNESTQQRIKVAEKYGQYRMLFTISTNTSIQVELHVRQKDNMTGLHFSEIGNKELSDTAMKYFLKLKERVIQEYGAENVSDEYSFMIP